MRSIYDSNLMGADKSFIEFDFIFDGSTLLTIPKVDFIQEFF